MHSAFILLVFSFKNILHIIINQNIETNPFISILKWIVHHIPTNPNTGKSILTIGILIAVPNIEIKLGSRVLPIPLKEPVVIDYIPCGICASPIIVKYLVPSLINFSSDKNISYKGLAKNTNINVNIKHKIDILITDIL